MRTRDRMRQEAAHHVRMRELLCGQPYREEPQTLAMRRRHNALNRIEERHWQQQAQQ